MNTTQTQFESVWENSQYIVFYDKLDRKYNGLYSKSAESLAEQARIDHGDVILELGAGTGFATQVLARLVNKRGIIYATENSFAMLPFLRKRFAHKSNVKVFQLNAENIKRFIIQHNLKQQLNCVFSSFTYYYLYPYEEELFETTHESLKTNGAIAFNITNFLTSFKYEGRKYNFFTNLMKAEYDALLKEKGFPKGLGIRWEKALVEEDTFHRIKQLLNSVGFRRVVISPFRLPVTPSQVLLFMIKGFYQYGSSISWSTTLAQLPLKKRVEILLEGQKIMADKLDALNDSPTIMNITAEK